MGRLILLGLLFAVTVQLSGAIDLITEDGHSLKFAWINYDKTRSSFPQCCGGNSDCSMVRISSEVDEIVRDKHEIYGLVNTWIHGRGNNIRMILSYSLETNRLSGTVYDRRGIYSIVSPTEAEKEIQPCFEPKVGDMSLYYKLIKTSNNPGQVFPVPLIQFIDISPPSGCCPPGKDCKVVDLELQSITSQSNPPLYLPTSYDPSTSAKTIYTLNRKSPRGCSSNCRTILYKNNRGSTLTARKRSGGKYSISLQESGGNFYELLECGQESLWVTNQIQKHYGSFDEETTSASTGTTTEATTDATTVTTTASPVDGNWGGWGAWTPCDTTTGTKSRTRLCDNPAPLNSGAACVGVMFEQQNCPVNGTWRTWGAWTACSDADQPTKTRTRACEGSLNGGTCEGEAENGGQETMNCEEVYGWDDSNWGQWSVCLRQGDSNTWQRKRTRACKFQYWRSQCNEGDTQTQIDDSNYCDPVNGNWNWANWGACEADGDGIHRKTRTATSCSGTQYGGVCDGPNTQTVVCVEVYSWGTWNTEWSECTDNGDKWTRMRKKNCDTAIGWRQQTECVQGTLLEVFEDCSPVNGVYGPWSTWSPQCSEPGTEQTRSRVCNNPAPLYGGSQCAAASEETQVIHCTWNPWTCTAGEATRTSSCTHDSSCQKSEIEHCGKWSSWSAWSECSCTNNLEETRTRACEREDSLYGKDCKDGDGTGTRVCPCNWAPWTPWSFCIGEIFERTKLRECAGNEGQANDAPKCSEREAIDKATDSFCTGYAWDCDLSGTKTSEGYDSGEYPANHNKKITINSGSSKPLNIKFLAFEMEDGANCEFDWVKIYDAKDNSKVWMDKTCGMDGAGREILTTSSSVIVETSSDGQIQKKGWSLEWCTPKLATVSSPNYPSEYDNNAASSQRIDVAQGRRIKLTFLDLNIEYHEHCAYDYVELTDKNGNALGKGKYCGYKNPDQTLTVTSTGNTVYVHFHSDDIVKRKGFQLQWEEI